ncbi:hypothetical protein GALL_496360 [mine drainage metagenome]|uniref:Uncharacterized protein n=1 Tax=mine drainage metagenome TaxID=410659 RepID=A0A1J5PBQ8_9ZZZZ
MLTSDLRYEVSRTHLGAGLRITPEEVRKIFAQLEQQATGRLEKWFGGPITIERSAEMRYGEQIFEIDVSLNDLDWAAESIVDQIEDSLLMPTPTAPHVVRQRFLITGRRKG